MPTITNAVFQKEPPPSRRGRPTLWVERAELLEANRGNWVDATAIWGSKRIAPSTLKRFGMEQVVRLVEGAPHFWVRIP